MLTIRMNAPLEVREWSTIIPVRLGGARGAGRASLAVVSALALAATVLATLLAT